MKKAAILGVLIWMMALPSHAQPTEKVSFDANLGIQIFGDYHFAHGSRLFFQSTSFDDFSPENTSDANSWPIDRQRISLGYEHFFGSKWAAGMLQTRNLFRSGRHTWQTQLHTRHVGQIGQLFFDKMVGLGFNYGSGTEDITPQTFIFRLSMGHPFSIKEKYTLLPVGSLRLGKDLRPADAQGDHRRISSSTVRFDLLLLPHPRWAFGIFAANQAQYFFALAQFDENMVEIKPFRRLNLNTMQTGITIRHLWQAGKKPKWLFNTVE